MKKILLLSVFLTCSYSACFSQESASIPQELAQAGDDDDEQVIWIGPGVYYGVWFDNEWEYNNWYDHHHHYRDRQDDDRYHGGDEGGGGEGGGEGGGGHGSGQGSGGHGGGHGGGR
jgi:hypothetical protein